MSKEQPSPQPLVPSPQPPAPCTCLFVPSTFLLTRPPTHGSLLWLSQEGAGKRLRQGKAKGTRQGEKAAEMEKRCYFDETNLAI